MIVREITFHDFQHASTNDGNQPSDYCLRVENTIDWFYPHLEEVAKQDPTPMHVYEEVGKALCDGCWGASAIKWEPAFILSHTIELPEKNAAQT